MIEALFVKKLNEVGVTMNFLRAQLHEFFFIGSFSKEHFENVSSFFNTMKKMQEMVIDAGNGDKMENLLSKSEEEITLMEFKIESAPSVSIVELEAFIAKFITYAINERDNSHPFLDENLLVK